MVDVMRQVEQRHLQELDKALPHFDVGDTVDVHVSITEGDKTRIQVFTGIVIGIKRGGLQSSFTVRRIVQGEGVERTFPFYSPAVADVKVKRYGKVRRAKLYYLRERTGGKATRVKERLVPRRIAREKAAEAERQRQAQEGGKQQRKKRKRGRKRKKAKKS